MVNMRKKKAHAWKLLLITIYTINHGPEEEGGNTKKTAVHRSRQLIQQIMLQVKVALRWTHAALMGALKEHVWGRNQASVKSFLMNHWCSCASLAAIATSDRHCLNKPKAAVLGTRHEIPQGILEHFPPLLLEDQSQSWRGGEVIFCSYEVA